MIARYSDRNVQSLKWDQSWNAEFGDICINLVTETMREKVGSLKEKEETEKN